MKLHNIAVKLKIKVVTNMLVEKPKIILLKIIGDTAFQKTLETIIWINTLKITSKII